MEMIWRENEFRRMGGDIGEMEEMVMKIEMIEWEGKRRRK